jgi:hypothetical protein
MIEEGGDMLAPRSTDYYNSGFLPNYCGVSRFAIYGGALATVG